MKMINKLLTIGTIIVFTGCTQQELAPDLVSFEGDLNQAQIELVEIAIQDQACRDIEVAGFPCKIPEQLHSFRITWEHKEENTNVKYELLFCLKRGCPLEPQPK